MPEQDRTEATPDPEASTAASTDAAASEQAEAGQPETGRDEAVQEESGTGASKEWWDDPRMPWKGKPGRADLLCWAGFSLSGVIGLVMIPLRPILIGTLPLLLVALTGSRSGLVTIGALGDVGQAPWWWIGLIVGIVSAMKWDPLFWWAGRLWGKGLIGVISGRSRWAAFNAARAERLARRWAIPAVLLTWLPFVPAAIVYATVGMAGMRLRTFLIVDLIGSTLICSLWMFLGFQLGQSAVDVVELIAKYSGYISIGLIVIIIANAYIQSRRRPAPPVKVED